MGAPIDMNPVEAIIWSIRITAGEVKWLSEQIAEIDEKDWHENTVQANAPLRAGAARSRGSALQDGE
jgi:hypothetical protein